MSFGPDISIERIEWGWLLKLFVAAEAVSGLAIVDQRVRLRGTTIRSGGISGVCTLRDHRLRAYASRVKRCAVSLLAQHRFDMSILFGYSACFSDTVFSVDTDAIDVTGDEAFTVRAMCHDDLSTVIRLFNRSNRTRTGSAVREKNWGDHWRNRGRVWYAPPLGEGTVRRYLLGLVAVDARNRVTGYIARETQLGVCAVIAGEASDERAFDPLLHRVRTEARRAAARTVRFYLPDDHRLGMRLRRFDCERVTSYPKIAGYMVRLIDSKAALRKMFGSNPPAMRVVDGSDLTTGRGTRIP